MTAIMSCDHHDESGLVPSNRSRARMLQQLRAASALADALSLWRKATVPGSRIGEEDGQLTVTLPLSQLITIFDRLAAWRAVAPAGDDWAPAFDPPSNVRVPPDSEPPPSSRSP